jgi:aspartate-semialdehyde dehydrogenase
VTTKTLHLGIVGWRGMVGSVLMERMLAEKDFTDVALSLFSTSQSGSFVPEHLALSLNGVADLLPAQLDAYDLEKLGLHDVIISCQGGDYTQAVHADLRKYGWQGFWIDAASTLRMHDSAIIVLDPLNRENISQGMHAGVKDFIGGNCTVSLMLMALAGLFKAGIVEWITSMTYQAASGAGAEAIRELLQQYADVGRVVHDSDRDVQTLQLEKNITTMLTDSETFTAQFGAPLATNLLPWIDKGVEEGRTREEWKGHVETNKILGTENNPILVDGTCVRVGALRCHSQALTIKLKEKKELSEVIDLIAAGNEWVEVIENNRTDSISKLTPLAVSGSLKIPVGRVRQLRQGADYFTAFTVGDQLLWGAAEPLRRVFRMIKEANSGQKLHGYQQP